MVEACLQWRQPAFCCLLAAMLVGAQRAKWSCKATCRCPSINMGTVWTWGHAVCMDNGPVLQLISTDVTLVDCSAAKGQFISAKGLAKRWFSASLITSATDSNVVLFLLCLWTLSSHTWQQYDHFALTSRWGWGKTDHWWHLLSLLQLSKLGAVAGHNPLQNTVTHQLWRRVEIGKQPSPNFGNLVKTLKIGFYIFFGEYSLFFTSFSHLVGIRKDVKSAIKEK